MFGIFRKKPPPPLPSNPGVGATAKVGFSNNERSWAEDFDAVELASAVLREHGHTFTSHKTWLEHSSGLLLTPQFVGLNPLERCGVRTVTTIQVNHPQLVPEGVFEYQHSTGDSTADSIRKGFDEWAQTDFVALVESTRTEPEACMRLKLELPARDGHPPRERRAILGPVTHYAQHPTPDACADMSADEHSFCPCCLLTRSFEVFKALFEGERFHAVRLFAARDVDGSAQADCRVNGDDYPAGADALRAYATTWPPAGYEFRKQYVILQNAP